MELLELNLNRGDILKAQHMSSIVEKINEIINSVNSQSEGSSGENTQIVEIAELIVSKTNDRDLRLDAGYTAVSFPYGIWLKSYLSSDLIHPINSRLLQESEYTTYLGVGYTLTTSVSYKCDPECCDEYSGEPFSIMTINGNDRFNVDGNLIVGMNVPTKFDVLVDDKYNIESEGYGGNDQVPWNFVVLVGNAAVTFDVEYKLKPVGKEEQVVHETYPVGFKARQDRKLSDLFCIIPAGTVSWNDFKNNPQTYINQILANEQNPVLLSLNEQRDTDFINLYKREISQRLSNAGMTVNESQINSYLSEQRQKFATKRVPLNKAAKRIVRGYFKRYYSSLVDELDFENIYVYKPQQDYYAACEQHESEIGPRFIRRYMWQDGYWNGSGINHPFSAYTTAIFSGPQKEILDYYGEGTGTYSHFTRCTLNQGDILVYLRSYVSGDSGLCVKIDGGDNYNVSSIQQIAAVSGSDNWVNNISFDSTIADNRRILENGKKKSFVIEYEDTIQTPSGNTYQRYGGDDYQLAAFEVNQPIGFYNIGY